MLPAVAGPARDLLSSLLRTAEGGRPEGQGKLDRLQAALGYSFKSQWLLQQALTHPSARGSGFNNLR